MAYDPRYVSNVAFTDLLFNIEVGLAFLFLLAFILMIPIAIDNDIEDNSDFIIILTWDDESGDDIDLWIRDPLGNLLSFRNREDALMHLDRDDLGLSNEIILGIFTLLFFLLAMGLLLVSNTLRNFAILNDVKLIEQEKSKPIWKAFIDNQFLMLCSAILFLLVSAYGFYGWTMQLGTNQGYMPVQPIHYSHKIHAGDNQIDCNYCHSSARVSKHSGIPSLNVCMNCHKTMYEYNGETTEEYTKAFYDAEIQKLYKAVGWDDEAQEYTGVTYPVKWVRIHNLPDFAYFNHAQHVSVAGIECQTCHGLSLIHI